MKKYKTMLEDGRAVMVEDGYAVFAGLLSGPEAVASFLRGIMLDRETEEVAVLIALNNKNRPVGYCELSRGSVCETFMDSRVIFRNALLMNATRIVVAHNHPSGDCTPSGKDMKARDRIEHAGNVVSVPLADFCIIGADGGFWSYVAEG